MPRIVSFPDEVKMALCREMVMLKSHDVNGDGRLSREMLKQALKELMQGLKELGARYPFWRCWRAKTYADHNDDGYIDWDELVDNLFDYGVKHNLVPAPK